LDVRGAAVDAAIAKLCSEPNNLVTVIVCLPDGLLNLGIALRLQERLARVEVDGAPLVVPPIRVRMGSRENALLLLDGRQEFPDRIRAFGMLEDICNVEALERRKLDVIAQAIHEQFRANQGGGSPPWEQLSEAFRESNRHAADHIETKLHAIGCHAISEQEAGARAVRELDKDEIELLARMEHERFCAERFLAGWSYAPPERADKLNFTNATLVAWDKLPEAEKDKDRDQVRALPGILERAGLAIVR
jgi:hypothetical protein